MGKRGPTPNPEARRSYGILVQVNPAEDQILRSAATGEGIPLSTYVRTAALRWVEADAEAAPATPAPAAPAAFPLPDPASVPATPARRGPVTAREVAGYLAEAAPLYGQPSNRSIYAAERTIVSRFDRPSAELTAAARAIPPRILSLMQGGRFLSGSSYPALMSGLITAEIAARSLKPYRPSRAWRDAP